MGVGVDVLVAVGTRVEVDVAVAVGVEVTVGNSVGVCEGVGVMLADGSNVGKAVGRPWRGFWQAPKPSEKRLKVNKTARSLLRR